MMAFVLVLLVALMLAQWMLARWVGRLPYAPGCPHCHAVTGQRPAHGRLELLYARFTATAARTCTRCGWAGWMRWRLAPERVAGHR